MAKAKSSPKPKNKALYSRVKAEAKRKYKVWPSAYASGRLVQCRKVGAANYGNKSRTKKAKGGPVIRGQGIVMSNRLRS